MPARRSFFTTICPSLARYESIVFATHGYLDSSALGMTEPLLVLSLVPPGTDGFLRANEVMGLRLNAATVVLGACQTGLGRQVPGEGTMGMGRSFQYAGARSVLMSLWSVAERSSVKLVENFFKVRKIRKREGSKPSEWQDRTSATMVTIIRSSGRLSY